MLKNPLSNTHTPIPSATAHDSPFVVNSDAYSTCESTKFKEERYKILYVNNIV